MSKDNSELENLLKLEKEALKLIEQYNVLATKINHNDRLAIATSQVYNYLDDLSDEDRYDEDGFDEDGYNRDGFDEDGNARSDNYDEMIKQDYSIRGLSVQGPGTKVYGWFASATANC